MVDGIVPNNNKTSDFFDLSYKDNALVVTEPYREWYIQSQDTQLKKILDNDNINYVDDVTFYENIKLKIFIKKKYNKSSFFQSQFIKIYILIIEKNRSFY